MRRLVVAVALLAGAAFPGQASAQFGGPFFPPSQEDYGPGITVSGVGFAPVGARDRTAARAMGDARRRAEAIASALGVSIGEVRAAELTAPFDPRPAGCGGRPNRRCSPLDAVNVEATFAIVGGPTDSEGAREIEGTGIANGPSEPSRRNSPAIRRSLRAARLEASPAAAEAGLANAQSAAKASGMGLGQLFSVVEPANFYGYQPLLGVFGAGRFCGFVRRGVFRPDPETHQIRRVRTITKRRCYSPREVPVSLELTYLGS
jgi:Protein of unknown function (DUF541)